MSPARATSAKVSRFLAESLQEAEASRRSLGALVRQSALAIAGILGALALLGDQRMGREIALAVLLHWLVFSAAFVLHRARARAAALYVAVDTLADASLSLCVIVLLLRSQTPSSPLWPVALAGGLLFGPRTPSQYARRRILQGVAHASLAIGFLLRGDIAAAVFAVVVLSTVDLELWVLHAVFAHRARARAERNVRREELNETLAARELRGLSRELHDSVGAEITALIFSLRRMELARPASDAGSAAAHAQRILQRLRLAVTELRELERRRAS